MDFVLDDFTNDETRRLKVGVQSRLTVKFKQRGVGLISRSVFDKGGIKVALNISLLRKTIRNSCSLTKIDALNRQFLLHSYILFFLGSS